jgi:glycerol-3-phosphate cytidylyltransferase-like family protein
MAIVLTTGCFAIPGPGHFALFQEIKRRWPDCHLVVGLNCDEVTARLKWYHYLPEKERAYIISRSRDVDEVVIFPEDDPAELVRRVKPQVFVKGDDCIVKQPHMGELEACREVGAMPSFLAVEYTGHTSDMAEHIGRMWVARWSKGRVEEVTQAAPKFPQYGYQQGETSMVCTREQAVALLASGVTVTVRGEYGSRDCGPDDDLTVIEAAVLRG